MYACAPPKLDSIYSHGYATAPVIIFSLLNLFFLPLISLAITCFSVADSAYCSSVKNKSIVTLVVSLAFIAGYYAFVIRLPHMLEDLW